MTFTWSLQYKSALKSRKAMFEIESCQRLSGNIKRTLAHGKIIGQNSVETVNLTEYKKYLRKRDLTNTLNILEICKKGTVIPVWDYDIGMIRGRDEDENLESDSIRASRLCRNIKRWIFIATFIFILGVFLVKIGRKPRRII